ncbi:uncharacterized protein LOC143034215 [Oratosquilla oratoria]|uniref:uncharacterized protein LOC143034215 n=1 Tax=Oratosquilla oratoria TaxID=337810 RepID=UPI003F76F6B5
MASLDADSLFSNVPLFRTIDIILNFVYRHPVLPPPKLPENILKDTLLACISEAPFRCPSDNLFVQKDGVAMGSPLEVLFAQAFMAHVEKEAIKILHTKPILYRRYVDDIYVCVDDLQLFEELRSNLQVISGLRFTVELNKNNRLPSLDVMVDGASDAFITSIYRTPTNAGNPQRFKTSTTQRTKTHALDDQLG